MAMIVTAAERQDLIAAANAMIEPEWPVFMQHDPVANRLWHRLYRPEAARFQFFLIEQGSDGSEIVIGVGNAIPFGWPSDGEDGLPDGGWDAVLQNGAEMQDGGGKATALSALSITLRRDRRGQGHAGRLIEAMKQAARDAGLPALVAPVRPTRKADYPLQDFARYCAWTRLDGQPFDPWIRVHCRSGARIIRPTPHAMTVSGTVGQWQEWTGLTFPDSGDYIVPGALVPVSIDRERDEGRYIEPNLWMRHPL